MRSEKLSDTTYLRARRLRRTTTDAEKRLWRHLRKLDLDGSHFRRQVVIGPYIADFGCMAARLLIEVDGSQHGEDRNKAHDGVRTEWLEKQGYRVLRFWNNDIAMNIGAVMEAIYAAIYGSTSAPPRPLKHRRQRLNMHSHFPTPARFARRPSPSRGGSE
ncbi:MAG: endonuclease domain-containing protein [Xanthobacteraceae bacterium]